MKLECARNVNIVPQLKLISPVSPIHLNDLNLISSECLLDTSRHFPRSFLVLEGYVWPRHLVGGRESIRLYSISISVY